MCGIIETGAGEVEANASRQLFDYSREKIANALINLDSVCVALRTPAWVRENLYIYIYIKRRLYIYRAVIFYSSSGIFKLCQARYFLSNLMHEEFINIFVKNRRVSVYIYTSAIYKNRDYLTDENADKMQKTKNVIIHYFDISHFLFSLLFVFGTRKFQLKNTE